YLIIFSDWQESRQWRILAGILRSLLRFGRAQVTASQSRNAVQHHYRAGAASACSTQPRSSYLHTVDVESLCRPLALFTTRSRLHGAPSLPVNCPRTCAHPDAPVLAFDHDSFALAP